MAADKEDLERFLKDVEEIGSIIKNLSSEDDEKHKEGMAASEEFMAVKKDQQITRTKYDKTLLNKKNDSSSFKGQQARKQEQLLKGIELDAKGRAERRKKNEAEAEMLKSKGNVEFKRGRYQEAIDYYTDAIKLVKYFPAFYTNRAQAYIKLKNYDAAIDDCKWAMRIDAKCIKAFVHCGRALQKKACFSEAISIFKKGEEIDPKQKDVIEGYISQAEIEQQKYELERKVMEEQKNTPYLKAVSEVIKFLGENKGRLEQCIVCVKQLGDLLENNDESKTLFRLLKGFDCFGKDTDIERLCENCTAWDSAEQEMFVYEMLHLGEIAVADNENNVGEILNHEVIDIIHKVCHNCDVDKVLLASVKLLHQLTEFTLGRQHVVNYAERNRCFVEELFQFLEKRNAISRVVIGCMNNLSLDEKFCLKHSLQLESTLLFLVEIFAIDYGNTSNNVKLDAKPQFSLASSCFATLANLARVKKIRTRLQRNDQLWRLCVKVLTSYVDEISPIEINEVIYAELGLLINLLTEDSSCLENYAISIAISLLKFLASQNRDLMKRVLGVLRLLMTYNTEVVQIACSEKSYENLLKIIEGTSDDNTISYGVKCLALCAVRNKEARTYISTNCIAVFHRLLSSNNETIVGNSALILSSCFEQGKVCEQLFGTSIVKDFLTLATRKNLPDSVKQNVSIALAKLVKQDLRFLDQLRDLHGVEILHSVVKSNNL